MPRLCHTRRLRQECKGFLTRMAELFAANQVAKAAFLVNNCSHILTKFKESLLSAEPASEPAAMANTSTGNSAGSPVPARGQRGVDAQNVRFWAAEFEAASHELVLLCLQEHFGSLLELFDEAAVAAASGSGGGGTGESGPDPAAVEKLVTDFAGSWNNGVFMLSACTGTSPSNSRPVTRGSLLCDLLRRIY